MQFASGVNSGELKSMRDSVSTWSAQGSEVMSTAGPSQPTTSKAFVSQPTASRSVIGPSRGPTIGPSRVSVLSRCMQLPVYVGLMTEEAGQG